MKPEFGSAEWKQQIDKREWRFLCIVSAVAVMCIISTRFLVQPYFEMRAFNKFSQTKATYWDAVFTELRVIPDGEKP